MKILLVNGSPHAAGNTARALDEVARALEAEGLASEVFRIGTAPVRGCIACGKCHDGSGKAGRCAFGDDACNRFCEAAETADGFVFGTPVYYGQPNGALLAVLQRAFFAGAAVAFKPAASVVVCRRGGGTAAFQAMNMICQMCNMPLATSQYWNLVYGRAPGDAGRDAEGLQTMRMLARNLAWMVRSLAGAPHPEREPWQATHFVRDDLAAGERTEG